MEKGKQKRRDQSGPAWPMRQPDFTFLSSDGWPIAGYQWEATDSEGADSCKGIVQIAHGMAEHATRYAAFAKRLNAAGYTVYANDHRGHGRSARSRTLQGYLGEGKGFLRLIEDMARLSDLIREKHPGKPLFLFGHSMGSFAGQRYLMTCPEKIDGLILSGSNGPQGALLTLGRLIAGLERRIRGDQKPSGLINGIAFGGYNLQFRPNRTRFDWVSSEDEVVDAYLADPYCGAVFPASFFDGFFETLQYIEDKKHFAQIPKKIPILLLSGADDPVGNMGKGVKKLYIRYREAGVKKVEIKIYEGCRHEILNDMCREKVYEDIISFLNDTIILQN